MRQISNREIVKLSWLVPRIRVVISLVSKKTFLSINREDEKLIPPPPEGNARFPLEKQLGKERREQKLGRVFSLPESIVEKQ